MKENIFVGDVLDFQEYVQEKKKNGKIILKPIYGINVDLSLNMNYCPKCLGKKIRKVFYQDSKGEREEFYKFYCERCDFEILFFDILTWSEISKKTSKRIWNYRKKWLDDISKDNFLSTEDMEGAGWKCYEMNASFYDGGGKEKKGLFLRKNIEAILRNL